ncbi:MAG TPA: hypothetical protein VFC39_21010 [Acidobacteriaceae bacterium]|nr:hypothetical protein [Acidobacteriaceae bacterium]
MSFELRAASYEERRDMLLQVVTLTARAALTKIAADSQLEGSQLEGSRAIDD